jgi:electron transfer flavoprotein alpha subunit
MTQILIVAEHDGTNLNPATAKCVTCARALPEANITIAVCAADAAAVAAQAARLAGVARVLKLENPANAQPLAALLAPQIVALAADFTHLLGPIDDLRQGSDAARRGAPQLRTGEQHHGSGGRHALPSPDLRRQCHRDGRVCTG